MNSFDVISVDYPVWFSLVVIATALYPFAAPAARRFHLDALAVVLLPVSVNLLVSLSGTAMITGALSTVGRGHLAASAGGAEVQMPLVLGCASAALTAVILVLFERSAGKLRYAPGRLTRFVAAALVALVTLNVAIIQWATRPGAVYSPSLARFSLAVAWVAAAVAICSVVAVVRPPSTDSTFSKRPKLLLAVAAVSVAVGAAIALLASQLLMLGASGAV